MSELKYKEGTMYLGEKMDIDGNVIKTVDNPEFMEVTLDKENKILGGRKTDGRKFEKVGFDTTDIDIAGNTIKPVDNPEFSDVMTDADGRVIAGVQKNGNVYFGNRVPNQIKEYVEEKIPKDVTPVIVKRNLHKEASLMQLSLGFDHSISYDVRPNDYRNLTFVMGSDFHGSEETLAHMFEYLQHYDNIVFGVNCGDTQAASPYNDDILPVAMGNTSKPVFNVIGNHDNGFGSTEQYFFTAKQKYERYVQSYLSQMGKNIVQPSDLSDYPCYYYKDFTEYKIRFVVVDIYDGPKLHYGNNQISNQDENCISEKQANFVGNALLSLPNDYAAIIAYHTPDAVCRIQDNKFSQDIEDKYIGVFKGMDVLPIADLVNAFVNKTVLDKTYTYINTSYEALSANGLPTSYSLSFDFSGRTDSEFICFLHGHVHRDSVAVMPDYNLICIGVVNGSPSIRNQSWSDIMRYSGTASEDSFNVISIDRLNKRIKILRIGADTTVDMQKRDMTVVSYDQL